VSYNIKIKKKALKALAKIPEPFRSNIINAIQQLARNPFPNESRKLIGRNG